MSQVPVKYAHKKTLYDKRSLDVLLQTLPDIKDAMLPVVPLSALREVVEGLRQLADPFYGSSEELDEWTLSKSKEPFSQWLAQRLLASLGEVGK